MDFIAHFRQKQDLKGVEFMQPSFNGLGMHLGNLSQLSNAQTRSISAENFTGEKGKGGMATSGTEKQAQSHHQHPVHLV